MMRDQRRKNIRKKHYLRTMGILMASVVVLSAGAGQLTLAGEEKTPTEAVDEKEEKMIVYLNGKSGKDGRSGESREQAVGSFGRAAELAGDYGVIRICGTVTVKGKQTWKLPAGVSVRRADDFDGPLVKVTGSLILDNVRIYMEDITGDGTVEGAVEREKVSVPKSLTVDEPTALSEIPLTKCEGDGVFAWEDEDLVLSAYETECKVIFHPYDADAVDYTDEKGWDEDEKVVVRKIKVYVDSLKPEEKEEEKETENTPEATPEPTAEVTPEPTPETTPEPTAEATPEPAPETTPEPTQEPTPEPAPESTPKPTPENTPVPDELVKDETAQNRPTPTVPPKSEGAADAEATVPAAGEPTPEITPETTPETVTGNETQIPEVTPEPQEPLPQETLTEEEKEVASEVQNQIDFLPSEVDSIEVVEAIVDATRWYESLTQEQRELFGVDTYKKLTEAQEKAAAYNRQCNGVTIEGEIPWYVQFLVELKNDKSDVSVLQEKNVDTFISPYDMKLWDMMNEEEYQLNGRQVRITIPAPDSSIYTQLVVVHYLEDGSVEYITPIYNHDGTMSFVTTSFSPYNVAGSKVLVGNTDKLYNGSVNSSKLTGGGSKSNSSKGSSSSVGKSSGKNTSGKTSTSGRKKTSATSALSWVPRTGDDQPVLLYAAVGAAALIVLVIIVFVVKRKNKR